MFLHQIDAVPKVYYNLYQGNSCIQETRFGAGYENLIPKALYTLSNLFLGLLPTTKIIKLKLLFIFSIYPIFDQSVFL